MRSKQALRDRSVGESKRLVRDCGTHVTSSPENPERINQVYVISPDGTCLGAYPHGNYYAQGVAVDNSDNVWVAHSLLGPSTTVGHLKTDGTFVGIVGLPGGSGPTGVAVDGNGKIWVANLNSNNAMRIDPSAGNIGSDGITRIGAVDLTVDLGPGAGPYNYSDMTGFVAIGATAPSGTWTVVTDGGTDAAIWDDVVWTASYLSAPACDASQPPPPPFVDVEVRAANSQACLPNNAFVQVVNGGALAGVEGRFIEIRATLSRPSMSTPSPILSDLTVNGHPNPSPPPPLTITASAGTGGTITPSGVVPVDCGPNQGFIITPGPCFVIADVLVDDVSVGAVTSYVFTGVTASHTIEATFAATITASVVGTGGSISPSGAVTVAVGADQAFTINTARNFHVADVLVDNVSVGVVLNYTFTAVDACHTIQAIIEPGLAPGEYYNGTYRNVGGPTATDLHVQLTQDVPVIWHYDGFSSGFHHKFQSFDSHGEASPCTVPPGLNTTQLEWSNGVVPFGDYVHVGWGVPPGAAHNICDSWWTVDGIRPAGSKIDAFVPAWDWYTCPGHPSCPVPTGPQTTVEATQAVAGAVVVRYEVTAPGSAAEVVAWAEIVLEEGQTVANVSWTNESNPATGSPETLELKNIHYVVLDSPVAPEDLNELNTLLEWALRPLPGGEDAFIPPGQTFGLPIPVGESCGHLSAGMVAWWSLNETIGTTVYDIIGPLVGGAEGTLVGGASHQPGMVKGAVRIMDIDQNITVDDKPNLNFGTGDLSIEAWVRFLDADPGVRNIVDKRDAVSAYSLYVYLGQLGFQLKDGSGYTNFGNAASAAITDGAWHHVAATVNRTGGAQGGKLYVDGAVVHVFDPAVRPGSLTNTEPLQMGTPGAAFNGDIDEVALFARAIDASEVAAVYQAGAAGRCGLGTLAVLDPGGLATVQFRLMNNPLTHGNAVLRFSLPHGDHVKIGVFDIAGRRLATLADAEYASGEHSISWGGTGTDGRALARGVYFIRFSLESAGSDHSTRLVILR